MKIDLKVTDKELYEMLEMDVQVFYRLKKRYPRLIFMAQKFMIIEKMIKGIR